MDQLIFASLSHTHYWYEVGMLKVPAVGVNNIVCLLEGVKWVYAYIFFVVFTKKGCFNQAYSAESWYVPLYEGVHPVCRLDSAAGWRSGCRRAGGLVEPFVREKIQDWNRSA